MTNSTPKLWFAASVDHNNLTVEGRTNQKTVTLSNIKKT